MQKIHTNEMAFKESRCHRFATTKILQFFKYHMFFFSFDLWAPCTLSCVVVAPELQARFPNGFRFNFHTPQFSRKTRNRETPSAGKMSEVKKLGTYSRRGRIRRREFEPCLNVMCISAALVAHNEALEWISAWFRFSSDQGRPTQHP